MRKLIGLALSSALALSVSIALPAAAGDVVVKEPFKWQPYFCGETVDITGVRHTTTQTNGPDHYVRSINYSELRAIGAATGDRYVVKYAYRDVFNSSGPGANQTWHYEFELMRPGAGEDVAAGFSLHITVNANGVETVDKYEEDTGSCS